MKDKIFYDKYNHAYDENGEYIKPDKTILDDIIDRPSLTTVLHPDVAIAVIKMEMVGFRVWESHPHRMTKCRVFDLPTILFHGDEYAGKKALDFANDQGWKVSQVSRVWRNEPEKYVIDPHWQIEFLEKPI